MNLIRFVPMASVMGTIFFLSHQPGGSFDVSFFPGEDKVAHFLIYFLLAVTTIFALGGFHRAGRKSWLISIITIGICILYGISDEYHQSFIPGRTPSIGDLIADSSGAGFAVAMWLLWLRRKKTINKS